MVRIVTGLILALCLSSAALAQEEKDLVQARLVADIAAIRPAQPFTVGIHFTIKPDWHIYWKHSGDSGVPTSVKFRLPKGFTESELQWPVPRAFSQPGGLRDYGYENTVMLLTTITPPATLKPGTSITLEAHAEWLVCHKVCLPGDQKLTLTLPVGQPDAAPLKGEFARLIHEWLARVPVDAQSSASPVKVEVDGQFPPGEYQVIVRPRQDVLRDVALYPMPPDSLSVGQIEVHPDRAGATITFKALLLAGAELKEPAFPIVIGFADPADQRRGVVVNVPLRPEPKP